MRLQATVSTHVLIVDQHTDLQSRVLLVRLSYGDHRYRKWALPGGFVDQGENLLMALRREVFEEVGLQLDQIQQVSVFAMLEGERPNIGFIFMTEQWHGQLNCNSREILEIIWANEAMFRQFVQDNQLAYPEMIQQVACLGW